MTYTNRTWVIRSQSRASEGWFGRKLERAVLRKQSFPGNLMRGQVGNKMRQGPIWLCCSHSPSSRLAGFFFFFSNLVIFSQRSQGSLTHMEFSCWYSSRHSISFTRCLHSHLLICRRDGNSSVRMTLRRTHGYRYLGFLRLFIWI
jgi:hypothetical protein